MTSLNGATLSQTISLSTDQSGINVVKEFLDTNFPLATGSHGDVAQYRVYFEKLVAHLSNGRCVGLQTPNQFSDFGGDRERPTSISLGSAAQQVELRL